MTAVTVQNSENLTRLKKPSDATPHEAPLYSPHATEPIITDPNALEAEIQRLCTLVGVYEEEYSIPIEENQIGSDEPGDGLTPYDHILEEAMHLATDELKLPSIITDGLLTSLLNAAYFLVEVWTQMVQHNGTIAYLTCHNLRVILKRHRKTQSMVVSKLLEHTDAPILRATAKTVYAYNDAVERYEEHIAQAKPFWSKDPSPGEEAVEARNAVQKQEADGRRLRQLSWNLNATSIHLGFKITKQHLWSTGFSHFRRLREESTSAEKSVGSSSDLDSATICNAGVLLDCILKRGPSGIVWSGKMIPEEGSDDEYSIGVTVKVAVAWQENSGNQSEAEDGDETETTRHEARVYEFLYRSGKQDIVPRYHGIFERAGTVALVLEYNAGEALETFGILTDEDALKLFDKVVDMHAIGLRHNHIVPRNIIQDSEGELRIIDFYKAEMDHRCRGKKKCSELRELRDHLGL